jgi:agmatine deiminase
MILRNLINKIALLAGVMLISGVVYSQQNDTEILPSYMTEFELRMLEEGLPPVILSRGIEAPPPFDNLRNMAEWEEIQALTVAWTSFPSILKQIIVAAKEECEVIILSENRNQTEAYLNSSQDGLDPIANFDNVTILEAEFNSIWMRDYAANVVYGNEVDDLLMVDWIYNRPNRPEDDASPSYIADYLGLDLYCLTDSPTDLVNTGGNYMSDGFGNAFASELILDENEPFNEYGVSPKDQEEIEVMLNEWIGVDNYILMPILPFDLISHIDMHMKLLDEETLLIGDFGDESDGPQIQANIEYILSNTTTKWGTPWKIVWIPMVPSAFGGFPDGDFAEPYYRTFTNSIFINKTILVPTYREEFDSIARRIYAEELPGYNVISIDCDDQPDPIISAAGALHCITHSVGVEDPLLISHNPLEDTFNTTDDYRVEAYMNHRSGITEGSMFWRVAGEADYAELTLSSIGGNDWEAFIPAHIAGTVIEYYIHGEATSGKQLNRPMPAPEGYWYFKVLGDDVSVNENLALEILPIYPNPAKAITVIPVSLTNASKGRVFITDAQGKEVLELFTGDVKAGETKFFFDAGQLTAGIYHVHIASELESTSQKLVVQ